MVNRNRMTRAAALSVAVAFVAACGGAGALLGVTAHSVSITANVAQADSVSFTVANTGTTRAYVQKCGDDPSITLEVQQGGQWVQYGPAITCPQPTEAGPIELTAGAGLVESNRTLDPGRYRAGVPVGTSPLMADAQLAYTAPFVIQ